MKLLTWPLRHRQVVFVLSFFALALGLNSLLTMPRQATPTISVFQAVVAVSYPGATAAEVVPCGHGCEHAAPMPPPHFEWVWCSCPGAGWPSRVDLTLCPRFHPSPTPRAGKTSDSREQSSQGNV
ncbi:MAG: efflux RND transporter permease subunit [Verrucomicrobia bacterium]|nr:efflux RND transporter permease subunit [Verrucomicrobiota bacterium]